MNTFSRSYSSPHPSFSDGLFRLLVSALVGASFIYTLAFDYLPGAARLLAAGLMASGYIALSIERVLFTRDPAVRWMFVGAFLIVLAWASGAVLNPFDPARAGASLATGFRSLSGLLAGVAILGFAEKISPKLIISGFAVLILAAAATALVSPGVHLGGAVRLAPFTGGQTGLHASAYAVALALLGLFFAWRSALIKTWAAVPLLGLGGFVLVGYQVRTALVLLMVWALVVFFQFIARRIRFLGPTLLSLMVASLFLVLLIVFSTSTIGLWAELSDFSSGRLATYTERINAIMGRGLAAQITGSGPGSDVSFSRQWYWGAKDSHNDFLRHIKEGGLIGALGLLCFFIGLARMARLDGLPFMAALVGSSAISNALLGRPTLIIFFFLCLVLLVHARSSNPRSSIKGLVQPQRGSAS